MRRQTDRRYSSRRWQAVRLLVLRRDLYRCQIAPSCDVPANVADHIEPVYVGMADAEFFDPANLRAACQRHNTARGVAARLERELQGRPDHRHPSPYSYGRRRVQMVRVF